MSGCALAPVHPRLRGELGIESDVVQLMVGSSPLTRGTHRVLMPRQFELPVHPRLRGELNQ